MIVLPMAACLLFVKTLQLNNEILELSNDYSQLPINVFFIINT